MDSRVGKDKGDVMTENRLERLLASGLLCLAGMTDDLRAAFVSEIRLGRGTLLRKDSQRVSVWAVHLDGMLYKIVFDAERQQAVSMREIRDQDLVACDCGHKHCHESCHAMKVSKVMAKPCRCRKCACPLCQSIDQVKL